jgi:hypothetical protein
VTLTVTDNGGVSSSRSIVITVQAASVTADVYVASIEMFLTTINRNATAGRAVITVRDSNGAVRPNVTVTARWSGLATDSEIGTTDSSGQVVFTSNTSKKRGTFTISVNNLAASGYTYNPSRNAETSDSVIY